MLEAEPTLPNRTTARPHTTVVLQDKLKYAYKRRAAKIYGNVARATHGLTQREVLGSGGGDPSPKFTLKQAPLTFLPANNPTGVADTLEVRVNDLLWREVASTQDLTPGARAYTVRVDAQGFASVQFGDGRRGARPPAGRENIRAVYRTGLGSSGNLDARKLTQLATRPLGVKDVTNPLPSLGGFDPESPDHARRNVAAGIAALQRLVSVPDYADFARGFAGVDKADAVASSAGGLHQVLVTVAGTDDTPLPGTELFKTLGDALQDFGDPTVPVELLPRRLSLIVLEVSIRKDPAALWADVEGAVRARLLDLLGFDRRELGEDVWLGPILAAIQGVAGVTAVDIPHLGTVPELDPSGKPMTPDEVSAAIVQIVSKPTDGGPPIAGILGKDGRIRVSPASSDSTKGSRGAEIAYLTDKVPATLVLNPKEAP